MKKKKNGFTLIELIVCIAILSVIIGIFSINFIRNLNNTSENEYRNLITRIESSADAYVETYKDSSDEMFEDIKLVVSGEEMFCYITLEEIQNKGFLDYDLIDPRTGDNLIGVVKFTHEVNGNYEFEYLEESENYIVISYDKNGADSITRSAQAFVCEDTSSKDKISECVGNATLPSITRIGGNTIGWSVDRDVKTTTYYSSTSLSKLLKESNYELIDNRLTVYAISSANRKLTLDKTNASSNEANTLSCQIYNNEQQCKIVLPEFNPPDYYRATGWNTNINGTGITYNFNDNIEMTKDISLYAKIDIEDFEISVNKLNRVSSTSVTPSNINIVLVLDVSGSMSSNSRLANLKKVCNGLVERMNLDNSTVSLISFSSSAKKILSFSQDEKTIKSSINSLTASGGTSFTAAISSANSLISQVINGKKTYVIFVSDGISSISSTYEDLISLKEKAGIYSMGIGSSADNEYLKTIASSLNNFYLYNDSADDMTLSNFYGLFADIVQDITIINGDGIENAIPSKVIGGKLYLNELVISENYPMEIYLGSQKLDTFNSVNEYFYQEDSVFYYFDVLEYSLIKQEVGLENMKNLRIKYFYKEDSEE